MNTYLRKQLLNAAFCATSTLVLGLLAIPAVAAAPSQSVSGAEFDRLLRQEDFQKYEKSTVQQIQRDLAQIYQEHPDWLRDVNLGARPLTDGIMGPATLFWMQRYCLNFKVQPVGNFAANLPNDIARNAAFAKAHPDENSVLISVEFARWNNQQSEPTRTNNYGVRRAGNDVQWINLVRQYRAESSRTMPVKAAVTEPLTSYSYVLTADDMGKLQGKDKIIQALRALQDQPFSDVDALKKAASDALAVYPGSFQAAWPSIEANISNMATYAVTDAALLALSRDGIPATTLTALESLKDQKPLDKAAFTKKVADALKLDADKGAASAPDATETDSTTLRTVLHESERDNSFTLNAQSLVLIQQQLPHTLTALTVPAAVSKLLQEIQDVSYSEAELLHQSAQTRLEWGIGGCSGESATYNKYVTGLRLSDEAFNALKSELLAASARDTAILQDTTASFQTFEQLRTPGLQCNSEDNTRFAQALSQVYNDWVRPAVTALYQKKYAYHPDLNVQWSGGSCGCLLDNLSGTAYGFYPFWKVNGKEQAINFSVMTRVGYYGLSFDDSGAIRHLNNASSSQSIVDDAGVDANAFISEAHRHNSKVDWVIEKNDWSGTWATYSQSRKAAILGHLSDNIEYLLTTKLTDTFSRLMPLISAGIANPPTRGDGVTLYFKGYPVDSENALVFNAFFDKLKSRLAQIDPHLFVNVMVSQIEISDKSGVFSFANLHRISHLGHDSVSQEKLSTKAMHDQINSLVLVLLEDPSTVHKKKLRIDMEGALHGPDRKELILSMLPVLTFDGKNWAQLQDDLIYFDDFGGVGFWPLSTGLDTSNASTCEDAKNVTRCIALNFRDAGFSGQVDSTLQMFVCQYRWWFRVAFDLSLIALAAVLVLYFCSCAFRNKVVQYFPLFLAGVGVPPIMLFVLLLLFDPWWANISHGNWPLIFCLLFMFSGALYFYTKLRGQQDVPSRAILKSLVLANQGSLEETAAPAPGVLGAPTRTGPKVGPAPKAGAAQSPITGVVSNLVNTTRTLIKRYLKK